MGIGSIYCKGVAEWTWKGFRRIRRDAKGTRRGKALFAERRGGTRRSRFLKGLTSIYYSKMYIWVTSRQLLNVKILKL